MMAIFAAGAITLAGPIADRRSLAFILRPIGSRTTKTAEANISRER